MPAPPTVALVTCRDLPDLDPDEQLVLGPLAEAGVTAIPAVWDDPAVDWTKFDLVVIRSAWDYAGRRDAFVAWARSVDRLTNPADVIAWNTDKRYLRELGMAGVPVVDTVWIETGNPIRLPSTGEVVLKPSVGAGSLDTGRYDLGRADHHRLAIAHVERLVGLGQTVMVQPYLESVDRYGERSLLFIAGAYSHSITKAAMLTGPAEATDGLYRAETITPRTATSDEVALAVQTLVAVPGGTDRLLYARVDLVDDSDGAARVLEVELTEPSLFLGWAPGSAQRLAAAIARAALAQRRIRS
jgi:hypothetical protein